MSDDRKPIGPDEDTADAEHGAVGPVAPRVGGPGMPRWVRVLALVGVALVVLVIVMLLSGHGPAQHLHHSVAAVTGPALLIADAR